MADISSSIMVASMIVGMLTVPAASKTIGTSNSISANIPSISDSGSIPREVSTNSSSESFTRRVETAFREFETAISSESAETSVESAGSRLSIRKSPEKTVWVLESSRGQLRIVQSSSKTVEEVETPYGSLKTVRVNGGVRESFEGSSREKVKSIAEELRDLMEQKKNQIKQQRTRAQVNQYSQNLEIITVNGSKDFVKIKNSFSQSIDLEGWKLTEDHGEVVFGEDGFNSVELPANGELYIYSHNITEAGIDEKENARYVYDSGLGWDSRSNGDTATLWKNGEEVATKSY